MGVSRKVLEVRTWSPKLFWGPRWIGDDPDRGLEEFRVTGQTVIGMGGCRGGIPQNLVLDPKPGFGPESGVPPPPKSRISSKSMVLTKIPKIVKILEFRQKTQKSRF